MCVQLEFTIHRGTHLCPPTPLAHTREESRTLRSRIVNTTLEMSLEVECHWCLGMGEEGEEPRDRTSPHSFAPLVSSPSLGWRGQEPELGAKAKRQSQEPEPRAFVPLRRRANRVALFFTHTHIHSLTYTLMHTHWCIRILRRTSDVEFSVLVLLLMIVLIIHSIVHTSRWPRVVYTLLS